MLFVTVDGELPGETLPFNGPPPRGSKWTSNPSARTGHADRNPGQWKVAESIVPDLAKTTEGAWSVSLRRRVPIKESSGLAVRS